MNLFKLSSHLLQNQPNISFDALCLNHLIKQFSSQIAFLRLDLVFRKAICFSIILKTEFVKKNQFYSSTSLKFRLEHYQLLISNTSELWNNNGDVTRSIEICCTAVKVYRLKTNKRRYVEKRQVRMMEKKRKRKNSMTKMSKRIAS